ncbi:hypothetical protein GB931_18025 [Modestobacter sp. I12A-02628]|uniref:Cell shape determination protein CcmA n=1 Tax=Goekera deserti TaxID=2497753 RepID=A0A7K3W863_9ACTN|nr:hypothetical protein [Goekera deserti]MPQ99780.1 hypothetical protein [Goekera deserti]NDI49935.1 hypothetical protein [Goekera deserti]NEL52587.1 hypothetical protein [Goekera deserti]
MFDKITGDVMGPLEIKGGLEINGTLHGGAVVTGQLDMIGIVDGPLEVRLDGHADVEAIVKGDVHIRSGRLRMRGIIEGRLGAKPGSADVQLAVGTVINGRRLEADGTFTPMQPGTEFSFPDDVAMMALQPDASWARVA